MGRAVAVAPPGLSRGGFLGPVVEPVLGALLVAGWSGPSAAVLMASARSSSGLASAGVACRALAFSRACPIAHSERAARR